jgi:hypothetical protein
LEVYSKLAIPMPSRNIMRLSINSPFNYIYFAGDSFAGTTSNTKAKEVEVRSKEVSRQPESRRRE